MSEKKVTQTRVDMIKNGPIIIRDNVEIHHQDGNIELKEKQASFCRCTHSKNMPYCDGSHKTSDFVS